LILAEDYAPWQVMYNYLKKYADKFHITERIRFRTKVISIDKDDLKDSNVPWMIKIETADGDYQTFEFDFVVVATGLFSTPYKPTFRGQNKFSGSILHTSDVKTHEQLTGKRVVVIGGGKSAADTATTAALYGQSCHMISRRSHWVVPSTLLHGYLPVDYAFSRLFTIIFDPYPYAPHSAFYHFLHRKFAFIFNKILDSMSAYIIATYDHDLFDEKIFLPTTPFQNSENYIRITEEFLRLKREGRIIRKLASIDQIIDETTIRLDTGEILSADLIICATGFIEQFPFLPQAFGQVTTDDGVDLDLYRRTIPVGVPNIAFAGLAAVPAQWLYFEVQSHWISDYFLGRIKLPDTEKEMYEEIRTIRNFIQQKFNRKSYQFRYYWLEPIEIFLQDMNLSLYRTNNWISECFGVYKPKRIKSLHEERQIRSSKHWYFSFGHTVLLFIFIFLVIRFN
jgi:hypothetical protein